MDTQIEEYIGIYNILQGLLPSSRAEYKFNRQYDDPVNGNNYVWQSTRDKNVTNIVGVYISSSFYYVKIRTDLATIVIVFPIGKLDLYYNGSILLVSLLGYWVEIFLLMRRQCMWYKGTCRDVLRITYKVEGDGFQSAVMHFAKKVSVINIICGMNQHPQSTLLGGFHHCICVSCLCLIVQ